MWQPIVWALLTGGVSGAAWVGIVLWRRQRRIETQVPAELEALQYRLDDLEGLHERLTEAEERLDFTERRLHGEHLERRRPADG
jgi:hypothetical protein